MSRIRSTLEECEHQFKVVQPSEPRPPFRLRRSRLRKISPQKKNWRDLYLVCLHFLIALDPMCRRCRKRYANQGHHPFGQHDALILLVFPFCLTCHNEVECNKRQSREEGWILYPIVLRPGAGS